MEWIACKDKMPDYEGEYLVVHNGNVTYAKREWMLLKTVWNIDLTGGFCTLPDSEVTHWMPLPEPPTD